MDNEIIYVDGDKFCRFISTALACNKQIPSNRFLLQGMLLDAILSPICSSCELSGTNAVFLNDLFQVTEVLSDEARQSPTALRQFQVNLFHLFLCTHGSPPLNICLPDCSKLPPIDFGRRETVLQQLMVAFRHASNGTRYSERMFEAWLAYRVPSVSTPTTSRSSPMSLEYSS